MLTRFRERFRALVLMGGVLAAASSTIACGDDDTAGPGTVDAGTPPPPATNPPPANPPPANPPPVNPPTPPPPPPAAATPTFTPPPGNFTGPVPGGVTIATTTAGAEILYTTDGTNPN